METNLELPDELMQRVRIIAQHENKSIELLIVEMIDQFVTQVERNQPFNQKV